MAASPAPLIRPLLVQDNVNIDERRLKVSGLLEQVFLWWTSLVLTKSTNGVVHVHIEVDD